jgi:hypothetical protein
MFVFFSFLFFFCKIGKQEGRKSPAGVRGLAPVGRGDGEKWWRG